MQFFTGISRITQSNSYMLSLTVSGISKIMNCGILINMPYWYEIDDNFHSRPYQPYASGQIEICWRHSCWDVHEFWIIGKCMFCGSWCINAVMPDLLKSFWQPKINTSFSSTCLLGANLVIAMFQLASSKMINKIHKFLVSEVNIFLSWSVANWVSGWK